MKKSKLAGSELVIILVKLLCYWIGHVQLQSVLLDLLNVWNWIGPGKFIMKDLYDCIFFDVFSYWIWFFIDLNEFLDHVQIYLKEISHNTTVLSHYLYNFLNVFNIWYAVFYRTLTVIRSQEWNLTRISVSFLKNSNETLNKDLVIVNGWYFYVAIDVHFVFLNPSKNINLFIDCIYHQNLVDNL